METQLVLLSCHGLVTMLVVGSFLCGQWPIFQGTPIERLHIFLTYGAYDYFLRFVGFIFGQKGTAAVLSVERFICDRPNPILQIIYLVIVGGTYYFVATSSFDELPGYYLSEAHVYISMWAVGVGVVLFLLTSFCDPGTVTANNVAAYITAYPYDNTIYSEKECTTCKFLKPARSKHCSICDRCVARFDHHCGWMNNCIGEKNTRCFLAFLLWHCILCMYGAVAVALLLAGKVKELKIVHILTVYYGVDNSYTSLAPHVVQWLLGSYNTQILLFVFLAIVSLLLLGFFVHHAKLCITNTTTNEIFKWQEYRRWQTKIKEAKMSAASLKASISGANKNDNSSSRSALEEAENVKERNIYDKGLCHNLEEVISPFSGRSTFAVNKPKSG